MSTTWIWVALAVLSLSFVLAILHDLHELLYRAEILITSEILTVATPDSFPAKRRRWQRSDLRAIGCWQGLRIVAGKSTTAFLADWDHMELRWVAVVLRQALGLTDALPPRVGEVSVTYRGTLWNNPQDGILVVRPGELRIRSSLAVEPHLTFRTRRDANVVFRQFGVVYLSPADMICRPDDSGVPYLEISPADVYCVLQSGGKTWLRVGSLGLFLYERVDLPRYIAEKKALPGADAQFWLSITCTDPEALPHAVETFWSAKPE
jgi:hypothetical protein